MELPHINLWDLGEDGFFNVRHPVIHSTDKGTLLVIAGGRRHDDTHEEPDQDLVMKRSTDGGKTWSRTRTLWDPWDPGDTIPVIEAQMCTAATGKRMLSSPFPRARCPTNATSMERRTLDHAIVR